MHRPLISYQFDDVVVSPDTFSVEKAGQVLSLEPKSLRVLLYLLQNRSRAVEKDELIRSVWEDAAVTDNALSRVIAQLRKALGDDAKIARYIETVPTIGYRFIADVVELAPRASVTPPLPQPVPPRTSRLPIVAALVFALLGVLVAVDIWMRVRPQPQTSWSGTLLGGSIIASHPRISPDGQLLAFRAIVDGQSQVAVMRPDSASWTVLTHDRHSGAVATAVWSWDGSQIYFDREWGPGRVYVIGALGGEPRLVLERAWRPEPLPDGSLIAERPSSEGSAQLIRFWPDSGQLQVLPIVVGEEDCSKVRAFRDGREIAVFGLPVGQSGEARPMILNLKSLQTRDLASGLQPDHAVRVPLTLSPDNQSVLVARPRNDTVDIVALPRSGSGAAPTLMSVPAIAGPLSLDAAPDGSLYMDHSGHDLSILKVSPSGAIQAEIPLPRLSGARGLIGLPDGGVVFPVPRRGQWDLFIGRPGAEPQLLLHTAEPAALPGTLLGQDKVAFLIGVGDQQRIAIASLRDGTVIHRFPTRADHITAMSAPVDGQALYYASNGAILAQAVSGGEPRKIGEGYDLAVEPSGKYLFLMRTGADGHEMFRMPSTGGEATRIAVPTGFNLTQLRFSSSAVDRDGRILCPVNTLDVFFYQAGVFDPVRNVLNLVPIPPRTVAGSAAWAPDGDIIMRTARWSSSLWRYRISK